MKKTRKKKKRKQSPVVMRTMFQDVEMTQSETIFFPLARKNSVLENRVLELGGHSEKYVRSRPGCLKIYRLCKRITNLSERGKVTCYDLNIIIASVKVIKEIVSASERSRCSIIS